ncbi:MAG: amidohydrolase family protein, partial [Candidatus Sumerlaeia bacterium]|nr:amidohydrolase family protein [Candidatus Sumerlaeia bacterium]
TMGGAIASGDASNRGSLSPGKWGDMVVLARDPRTEPVEDLPSIPVRMTFLSGKLVYQG